MEQTTEKPKAKYKKEKPPAIEKKKEKKVVSPPYTTVLWKGAIEIYKCSKCDFYTQIKDEIIIHVIEHLPQAKQTAALDNLTEA